MESWAGDVDPKRLFSPRAVFEYGFDLVELARGGVFDGLLVPHAFGSDRPVPVPYAREVLEIGRKVGLRPMLFVSGDLSYAFSAEGFTLLKGTQYRDSFLANDVIVPPICEDLGEIYGVAPRPFPTGKPSVGFCGWAAFGNWRGAQKARAKGAALFLAEKVTGNRYYARAKGLLFRRAAIRGLRKDSAVDCRFVVRDSFSGSASTISLDPENARREYVENMVGSDFVLAPKGDANYSVRFFEALSLGRIPILVDTEVCLPDEGSIDYDRFIVRVPYREVGRVGDYVRKWLAAAGPEGFARAQALARKTFEERLRYDSFFGNLFARAAKENPPQSLSGISLG